MGDLNIEWSCRKTGVEGGYKIPEAFRLLTNVSVNLSQQTNLARYAFHPHKESSVVHKVINLWCVVFVVLRDVFDQIEERDN